MRSLLFSLLALTFLALIALNWKPSPEEPSPATAAEIPSDPYRGPASLSSAPAANTPAASLAEIRRLDTCYASPSDSCLFPKAHARSYQLAVSESLAVALAEHFTNFGPDPELARSKVQSTEPIVQAVALRMLAALPPSGENLSALGNGLRHTKDPALVEGAVRELERYLGTSFEADAQRIVETIVDDGAHTTAQRAAALARPFINEHSHEEFRALLSRLDTGAEAAKVLRNALEQYERSRNLATH